MSPYTEFVPYKSVQLEKLTYGMNLSVSVEAGQDFTDHYIAYQVFGYVWAQDARKREVIKYPLDWWEAFKARWFPAWLLERYPVLYRVHEFEVKATYPDLNIQNHQPVLRLLKHEYTTQPWEEPKQGDENG